MRYHGFHLLSLAVKLDGLTTLFIVAGAGLSLFVWPVCGVIIGLFLE